MEAFIDALLEVHEDEIMRCWQEGKSSFRIIADCGDGHLLVINANFKEENK